ncbi:nitroreductase family protein [Anditalea andensis]|uniref:Nitroreductase domain-containing protein n=1 Tax=Anditalea andensis TaxID=1048983 RepID=A0A074KSE0_9BACT|nr:nitroreductase family protein [Anditalea andensis]KEO71834.1 hypothetical protein EL17_21170 [Anditalea andensis]
MLKNLIKKLLPPSVVKSINQRTNGIRLKKAQKYDFEIYYNASDLKNLDSPTKLISLIVREYHAIEKGLIMPEFRLGFGADRLISLCKNCNRYISLYGLDDEQLQHALAVIFEYEEVHNTQEFNLNPAVITSIQTIKSKVQSVTPAQQRVTTKEEYFKSVNAPFPDFSNSRSSVRSWTNEDVAMDNLVEALNLARNTPSACNRQTTRTYIYTNKEQIEEILLLQGGNRGFGHLTNKLLVITADMSVYTGIGERNQAFVDGGMYAMNILYAIHYQKIAACILNCSTIPEKEKQLRKICNIKNNEVFIAMVACGIPPEKFKIAASKRNEVNKTNKIFN